MQPETLCYTRQEVIHMENNQCKNCGHFLQHYIISQNRLIEVYCGHCIYLRAKRKRPDSKACEHFIQGQPVEESFVSKEASTSSKEKESQNENCSLWMYDAGRHCY